MNQELKEMLQSLLKEALQPIHSNLVELNQITRAMRDRQDETDAKLQGLALDVHRMYGEITGIKQEITGIKQEITGINKEITEIKVGQDRQNRILETLALHSLEQETIIRELKRIK